LKNIEITKNYFPETTKEIFNQKDIIEYILIQLMENSIKYSKSQGGKILLEISKSEENQNLLQIKVEDEGVGISNQRISQISMDLETRFLK
jgi:signal transduction histidine kinase